MLPDPPRWLPRLFGCATAAGRRREAEIARLRRRLREAEFGRAWLHSALLGERIHHREMTAMYLAFLAHYEGQPHDQITVCTGRPCWKQQRGNHDRENRSARLAGASTR